MSLREVQELFWRAITHPTGVADFLAASDVATREAFTHAFAETPEFSRRDRVDVYASMYFHRLHGVLAEQFEVARFHLGPARFNDLVTDYLLAHPSDDPDIRRIGARLPGFVRTHRFGAERPWLWDVCDVEWAIVDSIDAADEAALRLKDLAARPAETWPRLRFEPRGTTRLFGSRYDLVALWQASHRGPTDRAPPVPEPGPTRYILVYRPALAVQHRPLDRGEAAALSALLRGATLEEICAAATSADPSVTPEVAAAYLGRWVDDGLLAGGG